MKYRKVNIAFLLIATILTLLIWRYNFSNLTVAVVIILYVHLLVLGAIYIQWNFYVKSINSVEEFPKFDQLTVNPKNICLTFDDGIHPINTPAALEILRIKGVKAHFFIIGKSVKGQEAIIKAIHQDGHQIGNHSYFHKWHFDLQSTAKMQKEIEDNNKEIAAITGVKPAIFRPPFGVTNPSLAKAITNTKMISMGWNLRSLDTVAKSADALLNKLKQGTKPNSIVLLHERCDITLNVLTEYIDYCLAEGYTFVTLKSMHEV